MTTQLTTLERIITELKELNEFDGETVEYLLKQIGYDDYILRILMLKASDSDIKNNLEERAELDAYFGSLQETEEVKNLKHRLEMVNDDATTLRDFISNNYLMDFFLNKCSGKADNGITHLNNIEIACDLNSDESLSWKKYSFEGVDVEQEAEDRNGLKYLWADVQNHMFELNRLTKIVWLNSKDYCCRKQFFELNNVGNDDMKQFIHSVFDDIENNDTLTYNTFEEYWDYKVKQKFV